VKVGRKSSVSILQTENECNVTPTLDEINDPLDTTPLDLSKLTNKVSEYQHLQQLLKQKLKLVLNKNSNSLIRGMQKVQAVNQEVEDIRN